MSDDHDRRDVLDLKYYHGLLQREDIKDLLRNNGDFLVRMSEPVTGEPRSYVLSVMSSRVRDDIKHIVVKQTEAGRFFFESDSFPSIRELIDYYHKSKISLSKSTTVVLKNPIGRQPWEISHDDIECTKKLGEGAFGEVHKGTLRRHGERRSAIVAIKVAKLETMTKEQIKDLMREARLMRSLSHPHVVRLYGVAAGEDPIQLVMELASNGALDSYLKNNEVLMDKKAEMCMHAAWGIEYLHEKQILHRDIAARNCLYGDGKVKISDFGLSREGTFYQMDPAKRVPIRWLAPETLRLHIYTQKTDVFSFGILCWEIYHNAKEPYRDMTPGDVCSKVKDGYRMDFYVSIQPDVKKLINEGMWVDNANERANMEEVCRVFEKLLHSRRPEPTQPVVKKPRNDRPKPKEREVSNRLSSVSLKSTKTTVKKRTSGKKDRRDDRD